MTQSKTYFDSVRHHLAELLEGALATWNVVADVTVKGDRPEALVIAADGTAVQVSCRLGSAGDWRWVVSYRDRKTEQPWSQIYPSVLTMLRGLRTELAPDHPVCSLVITPSAVSL